MKVGSFFHVCLYEVMDKHPFPLYDEGKKAKGGTAWA